MKVDLNKWRSMDKCLKDLQKSYKVNTIELLVKKIRADIAELNRVNKQIAYFESILPEDTIKRIQKEVNLEIQKKERHRKT